ncbi:MAG: hypothetical protein U1A77_08420 [Pirellulales bacterium]
MAGKRDQHKLPPSMPKELGIARDASRAPLFSRRALLRRVLNAAAIGPVASWSGVGRVSGALGSLAPPLLGAAALANARSAAAGQRWFDERIEGPLHVHADFSLAVCGPLIDELILLQDDLCKVLEVPPAKEPIHLFLFERKPVYIAYLRQYFPRVPYRRALYVKERGPGMVLAFRNAEFDVDLRHETTHALLHSALAELPLWLDEGIAEYFEVSRDQRVGGNPYLNQMKWQAWVGPLPQLEDLEAIKDLSGMGRVEYRLAWAWTHFLLHGPAALRTELLRFVADARGMVPGESLGARLLRRFPDRDELFANHFKQFQV